MADDPKYVAMALLLGWQYPTSAGHWFRDATDEDETSPYAAVWRLPFAYSFYSQDRLLALSARAAVLYDTK